MSGWTRRRAAANLRAWHSRTCQCGNVVICSMPRARQVCQDLSHVDSRAVWTCAAQTLGCSTGNRWCFVLQPPNKKFMQRWCMRSSRGGSGLAWCKSGCSRTRVAGQVKGRRAVQRLSERWNCLASSRGETLHRRSDPRPFTAGREGEEEGGRGRRRSLQWGVGALAW